MSVLPLPLLIAQAVFRSEIALVRVDAEVRQDRQFVSDLTPRDFRVTGNGKPQPIVYTGTHRVSGAMNYNARVLRLIVAAWTLAAAAAAAQVVDGRVVNAATGAGLAGVHVILREPPGQDDKDYQAITDSEGRFRIEGVEDGVYFVFYRASGFWMSPFARLTPDLPTFPVSAKGDPVHLEGRMLPVPRIAGRVLDATGKPVPNATVWALEGNWGCDRPTCFGPPKELKTDEKGEFSFAEFDFPGTWALSATAPSSGDPPQSEDNRPLGWAQTFYPGVTDPALAERLNIQPGTEFWNIDIRLAAVPVHYIRGRVLDVHGDPAARVPVTLYNRRGPAFHQQTKADGTFEFGPVPDGEWILSSLAGKDGVTLWSIQSVMVKDADLEKVELRLAAPFTLHAKVVWEHPDGVPAPDRPPDMILAPNGVGARFPSEPSIPIGRPDDDGGMTFAGVYPGPYDILLLEPPPPPFYLESIQLGGHDALGHDIPILSDALPLILTYKFGGGTVRGTIENCGGARVVLIPQDPAYRRSGFFQVTQCDAGGQFEFAAVRPGEYYGIAIAADSTTAPRIGDEGILNRAARLTVRAGEHTTADIPVIK